MKLRVTPLSGLYSRIFNISLISRRPGGRRLYVR